MRNCTAELKNQKSQMDLLTSTYRNNANSLEALKAKSSALATIYDLQKQKVATLKQALEQSTSTRDKEAAKLAELRAAYDAASKQLASYGDEVDKNSDEYKEAQENAERLRSEIIKHQAALNKAEKDVSNYGSQLARAQIDLNNLDDAVAENDRLLAEASVSADHCATSIDRYGNAAEEAAGGTNQTASAVDALSAAMVAGGIKEKAEEISAALLECADASAAFETSIAKVYTLADESVVSQAEMKDQITAIAAEYGQAATDIGDAVYNALSAGVDTANALDFVRQSTQLSIAGFTDAATSVDVLTTVLNSYQMSADQTEAVASKLVKTQDLGKVSVDQLGKVFGRIVPSAAAYSVNLDNISSAYALMTANGINAENTTTYLSTMMDELADTGSDVAEILQNQTGKSFSELMSSGSSLGDVLDILGQSVDGDATAFSNLWSSSTAGKGALALFNAGAEKFNTTLNVMANSSGAVAANYEKMAATSEFASQRVQVAAQNLKIAVGDQLTPVLNKLKSAGADVLTIAADWVSQHPAVISAVTGLVTALSALATGLSAIMVAKAAAKAMEALNIALLGNPAVLIATGVVALGAALATFVAQAQEANAEVEALTASSRALADTLADSNQAYEDTATSVAATSELLDDYITQLEALEAQGLATNEQQTEYVQIVDKINALLPDLNVAIDEQTGLIIGGTDALKDQADAWERAALKEAAYTRYKSDIAAMADAEYELTKNTNLLADAQKNENTITAKLVIAKDKLKNATEALNRGVEDDTLSLEEQADAYYTLQSNVDKYTHEVKDLSAQQEEARLVTQQYKDAVDDCNQIIEEQTPIVEAATAAYEEMGGVIEETSEGVAEGTANMADSASGSLANMSEAYQKLKTSAADSLDKQFDLFEKATVKSSMSTKGMIANLQSQKKAFDDYSNNITLAMERGIDAGLVQKLSDGTTESMGILQTLVNATDEDIEAINAAFRENLDAKDGVATAIADAQTQMENDAQALAVAAEASAYTAGQQFGQGFVNGIKSKTSAVSSASSNLGNVGTRGLNGSLTVRSPSRKTMWTGEMFGEGYVVGMRKKIPEIKNASTEVGNASYAESIRAGQRNMRTMLTTSRQTVQTSGADAQVVPLLRQLLSEVKDGKTIVLDDGTVAGRVDKRLGQEKILKTRGAK